MCLVKKGESKMSKTVLRVLALILPVLAVILIGFVCAVIGFIVVVNIGFMIAPEFSYNGWEGYEATGPIGFIVGALTGLIGSSVLLFRKRTEK
jgi:hypothetical protein